MIAKTKNSGVEWIGDIPNQWTIVPLSRIFSEKQIKNLNGIEKNVLSLSYGKIVNRNVENNFGLLPESFNTYQVVDESDIILRLTDLQNDKRSLRVGYVREKGIITSAYLCLSLMCDINLHNTEYLYYTLHSYDFQKIFYNLGGGVRQSMGFKELKGLPLIVPPKEEQDAIVHYIKTKEEKINHFIQKKQRLIELLKEQRQSIINEAVREKKGWVSQRLKYFSEIKFSNVDKHTIENEIPVRLCNYVDVYKNDYIVNDLNFMDATASESEIERFKIFKDDVIITKDSEEANDIGVPALVKEDLENVVCGYHLALIRPQGTKILSGFLFRKFQSKESNAYFAVRATGVTRVGLSMSDITGICISYPKSLIEQQQIVDYIKAETATIDIAIAKAEKEIELIKEYKEAMITEAVTGKLQIKNKNTQAVPQKREANWEFKEAVLISVLTDKFGSTQYPLGRKRYTKFSYLFHRHTDNKTEGYLHKAAGPYNPKTKYAGPEKIALQNRYVEDRINGNYSGFVAGSEIQNAKNYFENYWSIEALNWLEQFRKKTNDELELYTTVDKAMVELAENKKGINLQTVKQVIDEHPEWKPKLERDIFSDTNIAAAMEFLKQLFV